MAIVEAGVDRTVDRRSGVPVVMSVAVVAAVMQIGAGWRRGALDGSFGFDESVYFLRYPACVVGFVAVSGLPVRASARFFGGFGAVHVVGGTDEQLRRDGGCGSRRRGHCQVVGGGAVDRAGSLGRR